MQTKDSNTYETISHINIAALFPLSPSNQEKCQKTRNGEREGKRERKNDPVRSYKILAISSDPLSVHSRAKPGQTTKV
jgi:hypothetical protein